MRYQDNRLKETIAKVRNGEYDDASRAHAAITKLRLDPQTQMELRELVRSAYPGGKFRGSPLSAPAVSAPSEKTEPKRAEPVPVNRVISPTSSPPPPRSFTPIHIPPPPPLPRTFLHPPTPAPGVVQPRVAATLPISPAPPPSPPTRVTPLIPAPLAREPEPRPAVVEPVVQAKVEPIPARVIPKEEPLSELEKRVDFLFDSRKYADLRGLRDILAGEVRRMDSELDAEKGAIKLEKVRRRATVFARLAFDELARDWVAIGSAPDEVMDEVLSGLCARVAAGDRTAATIVSLIGALIFREPLQAPPIAESAAAE